MRSTLLLALTLLGCLFSLPAFANALVVVQVRTAGSAAVDGTVTLAPQSGDGESYSCQTEEGSCRIANVPGGRYLVTFAPSNGEAPAPHVAMIPPEGRVTLHVATE